MTTTGVNNLPVELLANVFNLLELHQLLVAARTCRLWRAICSNPSLNLFRSPIAHILENQCQLESEKTGSMNPLRTLSAFQWIPTRNWIEILAMASPHFILFECNLPNLSEEQWEEAFRLRFPPSWTKWRRDGRWRAAFLKMLMRILHRLNVTCTSDEAWTSYIMINRNDNVNLGTGSSRTFSPHAIFNALKVENNLHHYPSTTRVVVQLRDVIIVSIGVLGPPTSFQMNRLAKVFLNPPSTGLMDEPHSLSPTSTIPLRPVSSIHSSPPMSAIVSVDRTSVPLMRSLSLEQKDVPAKPTLWQRLRSTTASDPLQEGRPTDASRPKSTASTMCESPTTNELLCYPRMNAPRPVALHSQYPNFTPGGQDLRWRTYESHPDWTWVGPLLVTALLIPHGTDVEPESGETILARQGPGRSRWASLTFEDLAVLAPWLDSHIKMKIHGTELGHVL